MHNRSNRISPIDRYEEQRAKKKEESKRMRLKVLLIVVLVLVGIFAFIIIGSGAGFLTYYLTKRSKILNSKNSNFQN
jgi:maltodextrin utilization protein YvdJ